VVAVQLDLFEEQDRKLRKALMELDVNNLTPLQALVLEDVLLAVGELKKELMSKGEATELFGQLRGEGLASAIATIEQGFGDELFYPMWPVVPRIYCIL